MEQVTDDPSLDGTDGAHPAWWRGQDAGVDGAAAVLEKVTADLLPTPNERRLRRQCVRMHKLEKENAEMRRVLVLAGRLAYAVNRWDAAGGAVAAGLAAAEVVKAEAAYTDEVLRIARASWPKAGGEAAE